MIQRARIVLVAAASIGAVPTSGAQDLPQQHLFTFQGGDLLDHAGAAVAVLGDVTGDGRPEVAVGAPRPATGRVGYVDVHDGETGRPLYRIDGPPLADALSDRFGAALVVLPDVDGDGHPELAVGAPLDDDGGVDSGGIFVYSGLDGTLLHQYVGLPGERLGSALALADTDGDGRGDLVAGAPGTGAVVVFDSDWLESTLLQEPPTVSEVSLAFAGGEDFGAALCSVGDLTGDGSEELAIGSAAADAAGGSLVDAGAVALHSGATGALLHTLEGDQAGAGFGTALARVASVDGDGYDELAVGAPWFDVGADEGVGRVVLIAGDWLRQAVGPGAPAGAPELWTVDGQAASDRFGRTLADVGDVSGDGVTDVAAAAPRSVALTGGGAVRVLSGVDGADVLAQGAAVGTLPGLALAGGDVDGDGRSDLVLGVPRALGDGPGEEGYGAAVVLSGDELPLAADGHLIPLGDGGTVTLSLQGPAPVAGHFYLLLGTASGTSPGLPSPVGNYPLNFDDYSLYTLTPTGELIGFWGLLDGASRAQAAVALPPGMPPSLVGFQLHYAWFSVDLGASGFPTTAVSNAVPLGFSIESCVVVPGAADCNGNGLLDACDVGDGTSFDCNANGVPDECELTPGGTDADLDGILDVCQSVIYVDASASGAGDGTSWANAYTELRTALESPPPFSQVWVAVGTYTPWQDDSNHGASFDLRDTVGIYGGFVGGETSLDQRDWVNFAPTLSGDVLGDDSTPGGDPLDNSWSVVRANLKVGPTAVLDGFRITAGNAVEVGACDVFAVYFSSCRGGGVYTEGAPTIRNCTIEGNWGGHHGGAIYTLRDARFVNCTIRDNAAIRGAGVYSDVGANPVFQDCRFVKNQAQFGGAVFATGNVTDGPHFIDCSFVGNSTADAGGAIYLEIAPARFDGAVIASNLSLNTGGGVYAELGAVATLRNSILWGNTGAGGGGEAEQLFSTGAAPDVEYCLVEGWSGAFGGTGNSGADPLFVDFDGADGFAGNFDDDLHLAPGSPGRDSGDTTALPADLFDLDGDGDVTEPIPFDADGNPRVVDDPAAPNTGVAAGAGVVDRGPFEG